MNSIGPNARSRRVSGALAMLLGAAAAPLTTSAQMLGDVTVTAARGERAVEQALADVTVITREQIEREGASSVPELLARLAGAEIYQSGGQGQTSGVFLRGTTTAQTLVLIDGLRVENPISGGGNLEFLSVPMIERIEVVRGPTSAIYGSAAMGGVIQIFTRGSEGPAGVSASVGGGTWRTAQASAGYVGVAQADDPTRAGRWSIAIADERTGGFDSTTPANTNHVPGPDGNAQRSVVANVRQAFGPDWLWGATARVTDGRNQFDTTYDWRSVNAVSETAAMAHRSAALGSWLRGDLGRGWRTELRLGQTDVDYRIDAYDFSPRTSTRTIAWQNDIDHDSGHYTIGLDLIEQSIAGSGVTVPNLSNPTPYLQSSRRTDAVYGAWERQLGEHLWRVQLREDAIEHYGTQPTGGISWGHSLGGHWLVRGNLASAFRAPTFDDLFNPFGSNPSLRPERSRSADAALEYRDARSLAKVTAFGSRIEQAIELDQNYTPQNLGRATVEGLTFEGATRWSGWTLRGSATVQNPMGVNDVAQLPLQPGRFELARRARHFASLQARYDFGSFEAGASLLAQGQRWDTAGQEMGGYAVLDLDVIWRIDARWQGFARVGNVFDRTYETAWSFTMPSRNVFMGVRYRGL